MTSAGLGVMVKPRRRIGGEDRDDFVLDQAVTHICAVFDCIAQDWRQPGNAQFVVQTPLRTCLWCLIPSGMGAAGIRPKTRCMILSCGALLKKHASPRHHEDADGLVAQSPAMDFELFGRRKRAVDPCRDHRAHTWVALTKPVR